MNKTIYVRHNGSTSLRVSEHSKPYSKRAYVRRNGTSLLRVSAHPRVLNFYDVELCGSDPKEGPWVKVFLGDNADHAIRKLNEIAVALEYCEQGVDLRKSVSEAT